MKNSALGVYGTSRTVATRGYEKLRTEFCAGEVGIEPTVLLLESSGLPLTDSPIIFKTSPYRGYFSLFVLFMQGVFFAEFTEFIQFQSIFQDFFVFSGKIVGILTLLALHFNQVVLAHKI